MGFLKLHPRLSQFADPIIITAGKPQVSPHRGLFLEDVQAIWSWEPRKGKVEKDRELGFD